jgi:putative CocE/NonD family hydrolase
MEDHLLRWEARDGGANQNAGAENTMFHVMQHRLDDQFWKDRSTDPSKIEVPMLTMSAWPNWGGVGHLRGTTEGFKEVASKNKRMVIYTAQFTQRTISFYTPDGTREHLRWFDRFLKGSDNGVDREPPVRIAIRRSTDPDDFTWRSENEWPLARTQYTKFYLDAANGGTLSRVAPAAAGAAKYRSGPLIALTTARPQEALAAFFGAGADTTGVAFTSPPFEQVTEVTGELALYLRSATSLKDMDVHASVTIVRPDGKEEVVTRGWLKASHRKLDPKRSTPSMPYHTHDEEQYLTPGEAVDLAIDVWPTSMVYAAGTRLRLRVAPCSPGFYGCTRAAALGENTIFTGGTNPAYLLVPIVPPISTSTKTQ